MVTTRNRAKAAAAAGSTPTPIDVPMPARATRSRRSTKKAPLTATTTEDTTSEETPSETTSVADPIDVVKPTVEDTLAQESPIQEEVAKEKKDERPLVQEDKGEDENMQEDQVQESDEASSSDSSSATSDEDDDEDEEEENEEEEEDDEDDLNELLLKAQESLKGKKKQSSSEEANGKKEPMFNFPKLQSQMDTKPYLKQENGRVKIAAETVVVVDKNEKKIKSKSDGALETAEINMNAHKVHITHKEKKEAREKTAGKGWFDMPQQVLTPELKRDLQILKLRNVLDPKRFYKREEKGKPKFPKYFQVGTVIEGNTEFYSSRLTKKERATTITGEVMKDLTGREYYKRKFDEIQESKQSGGKRFYKKGDGKKKRNLGWKK
ncbi:hypothetical protein BGW42_008166 [Actinomortierella wolfii]|nr:hypothetical protein BGW42_008166 [Actinomortierella wolfii]